MAKAGLAFSGGGVRSAAFCSGVLRRLLQRNANLDYLSCVSGGGYTGCAYMDWKFRNGMEDNKEWHLRFFDHFRSRIGIFCDWQRPLHAVLDSVVWFLMTLFVTIIIPLFLWLAYACPLAYAVDFCTGDIIRGGIITKCDSATLKLNETVKECQQWREQKAIERFFLFSVPLLVAFLSYIFVPLFPKVKNVFAFFDHVFCSHLWLVVSPLVYPWRSWVYSFVDEIVDRCSNSCAMVCFSSNEKKRYPCCNRILLLFSCLAASLQGKLPTPPLQWSFVYHVAVVLRPCIVHLSSNWYHTAAYWTHL